MAASNNVVISQVALSNTDASVLKVAISLLNKQHSIEASIATDDSGQIVIVDIDDVAGKQFYQSFAYPRGRQLLLLSDGMVSDQRSMTLRKPVRVQTLKDALFDVHKELQPQPISLSAPKKSVAKAETGAPQPQVSFEKTLLALLLNLRKEQSIAQIFCPPHSPLFVNVPANIVATSASREVLRKMTHDSNANIKSTRLSPPDFDILARGQMIVPLPNVLWSAALYGSQGHLLWTEAETSPVQLKGWPNLSRLEFDPEHMKLASLMTMQGMNLKQIQAKAQLQWNTVVGFFNAVYVSDLVLTEPLTPANTVKDKGHSETKRSLFSKIANRLKLS